MSDELVRRVDALVRRQEPPGAKGELPVLTEIVTEERASRRPVDDAALEALDQAVEAMRAQITVSVQQMVREAVAASVAFALRPKNPE